MFSSKSPPISRQRRLSPISTNFLLIPALLLLSFDSAFAYYAEYFYLPSGEFIGPFSGRFNNQIGAQNKKHQLAGGPIHQMEEQTTSAEDGRQQKGRSREEANEEAMAEEESANSDKNAVVIPRRTLRHFLAAEFGSGRMGRQYKRMRPCFYSPIQCLMKRSNPNPA